MDSKYKVIAIGIDQSYDNCGISISCDGVLKDVKNVRLSKFKDKTKKRRVLRKKLKQLLYNLYGKSDNIVCVIERIRLRSQGFINIDYIKSIGALNSLIVDVMAEENVPVYSVDTRCWKAQIVGTSKGESNKYGVPNEKWPTVKWCINQGFKRKILKEVQGRKSKGTFENNGKKWFYDNDMADSAAISLFYFIGDKDKLKKEN
jgi:hypothetical protein